LLLLHALRAVPGEVAVLGVGDSERLCQTVRPSLSSVIVPWRQIGHRAAEELIRQQETPGTSGWITLPPRGVAARASTRATPVLDPLVQRALVLISEQAPLGATVSDLLAALHVSRRTLETRFRQALGHTPLQELHTQRVARARRLLLHTDDKIESIARRSGFRGRDRFTKVFRRFTGLSPGEFRREQG
jgi:LacI family transcriptional regulator